MASNNAMNTELIGSSLDLKFNSRKWLKIFFYVDFRQKERINIIKDKFFK